MQEISLFDVIGPNMIGPSSSHTAGAAAMALLARKLFAKEPVRADFTLYGSFAETYSGHGTDKALLGGVMGFHPDDVRIRESFRLADEAGLIYQFSIDRKTEVSHPNTADILLTAADGTAQLLHALFAKHPPHRVGHIALTASVGSDNAGDPVMKIKLYPVGKGLEPLHLNTL